MGFIRSLSALLVVCCLSSSLCFSAGLDFDGDGVSDAAGVEYQRDGSANELLFSFKQSTTGVNSVTEFGTRYETPVSGDYDGDGITDLGVAGLDSSNTITWRIKPSSVGEVTSSVFGQLDDTIISGCDFDIDGKTDRAVLRGGSFFLEKSSDLSVTEILLGVENLDFFYCADINGDGSADLIAQKIVQSSGSQASYFYAWSGPAGEKILEKQFGRQVKGIFAADINGDGIAEIGYERVKGSRKKFLTFLLNDSPVTYLVPTFQKITFGKFSSEAGLPSGMLIKVAQANTFIRFPNLTDVATSERFTLKRADTVLPAVNVDTISSPISQEAACQTHHDPFDGPNGFLWKPVSDSNGNAVVLFPSNLRARKAKFVKNGVVIEKPYYSGNGNGGRDHFRSRNSPSFFPENFTVMATAAGSIHCWLIEDPTLRVD